MWDTTAGQCKTSGRCELEFGLHEFSTTRRIKHNFHVVTKVIPGYDMIIGRDLMHHLKLDVMFSTSSLVWFENGEIPLKPANAMKETPCFAIPKKDGTIRFISDFRELNKRVKRTPFPLPKNTGYVAKNGRIPV